MGYSFVILVLQQFCCTAKRIADLKEGVGGWEEQLLYNLGVGGSYNLLYNVI